MQLGLSEPLSALVAQRFTTAKEAGHLVFSPTQLSIITAAGIPYQLRYCPALAKKPTNLQPEPGPKPPKPDPFKDPSPDLLIAHFPPESPSHALVLNKFPVIPNHFILATKEWKAQTDLLEKEDLDATYACLRAWGDNDNDNDNGNGRTGNGSQNSEIIPSQSRLFAFFNSGEDSGASQPHRHLQFLPVEAMRADSEAWNPLIDHLATTSRVQSPSSEPKPRFQHLPNLPYTHFARPLPENPTPETLHHIYLTLYRAAVAATTTKSQHAAQDAESIATEGPASISYNLAMTLSTMMICPRRSETARIPIDMAAAGDIAEAGTLSLNGTILAGTLMVKAEGEWDALRAEPELLNSVLGEIGYARSGTEGMALL